MTPNSSSQLEMLINAVSMTDDGAAAASAAHPHFAETYAAVITSLAAANTDYVLTGAMAYALYAPARATRDIDILARHRTQPAVKASFAESGFKLFAGVGPVMSFGAATSRVAIHVRFDEGDPVQSAIVSPSPSLIFGTATSVITAEFLLWQYCLSNLPKYRSNAIELIKAGNVDLAQLQGLLVQAKSPGTLQHLQALIVLASRLASSSYSVSAAARIASKKIRR